MKHNIDYTRLSDELTKFFEDSISPHAGASRNIRDAWHLLRFGLQVKFIDNVIASSNLKEMFINHPHPSSNIFDRSLDALGITYAVKINVFVENWFVNNHVKQVEEPLRLTRLAYLYPSGEEDPAFWAGGDEWYQPKEGWKVTGGDLASLFKPIALQDRIARVRDNELVAVKTKLGILFEEKRTGTFFIPKIGFTVIADEGQDLKEQFERIEREGVDGSLC